jgi:glycosyltransferase involved in cell wall biosynthesis
LGTDGECGLAGCVTLVGECDHVFVKRRSAETSLFVQHSMTAPDNGQGSRGVSLVEAVEAGIPVVTKDKRDCFDAAEGGSTGRHSPVGTAQGMARNIVLLAASCQMRRDCSHCGRASAEAHFGAERTWERLRTRVFDRPMHEAPLLQSVDGVWA